MQNNLEKNALSGDFKRKMCELEKISWFPNRSLA